MSKRNLGQRVPRSDMGPQSTAFDQGAQFIELAAVLPGENEVITRIPASGMDEVLGLRDIDDRNQPAELCKDFGSTGQGVATDRIEHDIDATAGACTHHGFDLVFLPVVDDDIGPHAARELEVRRADGRDHPRTNGLRQLDRHVSDPARTAMHQDGLPDPERGTADECFPGPSTDQAQACGFEMAQRSRFPADDVFGGDMLLGIAARTIEDLGRVPDLVTWDEGRRPRADRFDHPDTSCPVMAGSGTRPG